MATSASSSSAAGPPAAPSASAAMQHNLSALQTQLQTLQRENSVLTKDLCLKENYIQLKEQQVRVMQKRLEELESAVAVWKDRYLQQLNAVQAPSQSSVDLELLGPSGTTISEGADDEWTPWSAKASASTSSSGSDARAKSLRNARALLDKLSASNREKLQPLLDLIARNDESLATVEPWEKLFQDVNEELSKILLLYLLPVLADIVKERGKDSELRCFSRTYAKQTMDFRIECRPRSAAAPAVAVPPVAAATPSPSPSLSPSAAVGDGGASKAESRAPAYTRSLSAVTSQSPPALDTTLLGPASNDDVAALIDGDQKTDTISSSTSDEVPVVTHLFECVDCDKRNAAPVPHGPRELHPTRAMYISRPLAGASSSSSSSSASGVDGGKSTSRRYTMAPNRSNPTFAVESTRLQSMNALPSPSSISAISTPTTASSGFSMEMDGDRRSGAASFISSVGGLGASKDGKIKKIMGSVMDRLNRHKPQLTTANTSLEDDESMCDGCGRGPLTGVKWVCRTCRSLDHQEYEMCEKCYSQGVHGKENEDALFERIEEIVVHKCPRLAQERELMSLLRVGICKANLKKFSFCLTWIADLLQCKQTKDLRARALEISQISPQVRSEFVRLLRELLQRYRRDIELVSEWEPVPLAASMIGSGIGGGVMGEAVAGGDAGGGAVQLDTLRIWVKDVNEASQQTQQQ